MAFKSFAKMFRLDSVLIIPFVCECNGTVFTLEKSFSNILKWIHNFVLTYILLFHMGPIVYVFMVGPHAHFICRKTASLKS